MGVHLLSRGCHKYCQYVLVACYELYYSAKAVNWLKISRCLLVFFWLGDTAITSCRRAKYPTTI